MNSILEIIQNQSAISPDKLCVADYDGKAYTYKQYWDRIVKISKYLTHLGLKKGDFVVLEKIKETDFTAMLFAIQLAGGVFIPLANGAADSTLEKINQETNPRFIICKNNRNISKNEILFSKFLENLDKFTSYNLDYDFPDKNTLAELLFTTGTTGESKGIMISHANNIALGENISYGVEMKKDNIELIPVTISHAYGLRSFYASMFNGSSVVFLDGFSNPKLFFLAIEKYKITSIALVPALLNIVFRLSDDYIGKYSEQLDYIQCGSAALSEDNKAMLCKLLPKTRLYNFYGSTESGRSCILEYNFDKNRVNCIGRPAHNADFKIVDDHGEFIESSRDNLGRLASAGAMNMISYWGKIEDESSFLKDGYILSNDICYIEDGYVYFMGRKGDIINIGGNKVAPLEIEEVANAYPLVLESACMPTEDSLLGQVPLLYLVLKDISSFEKKEFLAYLANKLEKFKLPKQINIIDEIPRMYNGKIDRKALKNSQDKK